jgi:hypothetical protein
MKYLNLLFLLSLASLTISLKNNPTTDVPLYHSPDISDFNHLPHASMSDPDIFDEEDEKNEELVIKENAEQNSKVNTIASTTNIFTLDKKKDNCDIQVKERVSFTFPKATKSIDHIIISKKTPLYGFAVDSHTASVIVKSIDLYQDTSYKQRMFTDDEERKLYFRDRWLITVSLNTEVKTVDLEFTYFMQRAVLIDPINNLNYLNFNVFNPYPEDIQYRVIIKLLNFDNLKDDELMIPNDTIVKVYPSGLEMESNTLFFGHSEYDLNLILPMEMETCEKSLVNLVYYTLIGMSFTFIALSLITMFYISKE